jgi:hypothetical protein
MGSRKDALEARVGHSLPVSGYKSQPRKTVVAFPMGHSGIDMFIPDFDIPERSWRYHSLLARYPSSHEDRPLSFPVAI